MTSGVACLCSSGTRRRLGGGVTTVSAPPPPSFCVFSRQVTIRPDYTLNVVLFVVHDTVVLVHAVTHRPPFNVPSDLCSFMKQFMNRDDDAASALAVACLLSPRRPTSDPRDNRSVFASSSPNAVMDTLLRRDSYRAITKTGGRVQREKRDKMWKDVQLTTSAFIGIRFKKSGARPDDAESRDRKRVRRRRDPSPSPSPSPSPRSRSRSPSHSSHSVLVESSMDVPGPESGPLLNEILTDSDDGGDGGGGDGVVIVPETPLVQDAPDSPTLLCDDDDDEEDFF